MNEPEPTKTGKTFWACHCLGCRASFGGWDADPNRLVTELVIQCSYCRGTRVPLMEPGLP